MAKRKSQSELHADKDCVGRLEAIALISESSRLNIDMSHARELISEIRILRSMNRDLAQSLRRILTAWEVNRDLTQPGVDMVPPVEDAKRVLAVAQEAIYK